MSAVDAKAALRPAFTSWIECVAFGALIAVSLALPIVLSAFGIPRVDRIYPTVPGNAGPFMFFQEETFRKEGEIDVLFLGPSLSWNAIDARMVRDELSGRIGRTAVVLNFGSNWRGEELYYTLFREMIRRRRIKLLVLNPPMLYHTRDEPHAMADHWLVYGRDEGSLRGLSLARRAEIFAFNVLGAPRHLLGALRNDSPEGPSDVRELGSSLVARSRFGREFKEVDPRAPSIDAGELIYGKRSESFFTISPENLPEYQNRFVRSLLRLAHESGTPVMALSLPLYSQRADATVKLKADWTSLSDGRIAVVGVPNERLFRGMSDDAVQDLYYDDHLNINGARFFTRTMMPAILEIFFDATTNRKLVSP